jgi:hypothetical protein
VIRWKKGGDHPPDPVAFPCRRSVLVPSSMTPAASHFAISRRTLSSAGGNCAAVPPRTRQAGAGDLLHRDEHGPGSADVPSRLRLQGPSAVLAHLGGPPGFPGCWDNDMGTGVLCHWTKRAGLRVIVRDLAQGVSTADHGAGRTVRVRGHHGPVRDEDFDLRPAAGRRGRNASAFSLYLTVSPHRVIGCRFRSA